MWFGPSGVGGAAVLVAPPGAGKTTRVPPALVVDGARLPAAAAPRGGPRAGAAHRRRAGLEASGEEVGWQVRFERALLRAPGCWSPPRASSPRACSPTRCCRRLSHRRPRRVPRAQPARRPGAGPRSGRPGGRADDLRVVVMSATLDAAPVARVPRRLPGDRGPGAAATRSRSSTRPASRPAGRRPPCCWQRPAGTCCASCPGRREIRRAGAELRLADVARPASASLPLHGTLAAEEQDAALAPCAGAQGDPGHQHRRDLADRRGRDRRGRHRAAQGPALRRRARASTASRPSASPATRRSSAPAGPAAPGPVGRCGCGTRATGCARTASRRSSASTSPGPSSTSWPGAAIRPLRVVRAAPRGPRGRRARAARATRAPLHDGRDHRAGERPCAGCPSTRGWRACCWPAGARAAAAAACAVLSEGRLAPGARRRRPTRTSCSPCDRLGRAPPDRAAARPASSRALARVASNTRSPPAGDDRRFAGRSSPASPTGWRAGASPARPGWSWPPGTGARARPRERGPGRGAAPGARRGRRPPAGLGGARPGGQPPRAGVAPATRRDVVHRFDEASGVVRACERSWYRDLLLAERPVVRRPRGGGAPPGCSPEGAGAGSRVASVQRRARLAGVPLDVDCVVEQACAGRTRLADVDLVGAVSHGTRAAVDRAAPTHLALPSGRRPAGLPRRRPGGRRGEAAGALRTGRDAPVIGPERRAGHVRAARAQRPAGADHARPAQLLGRGPTRRCAGSCGAATRGIPGPRTRGRPSRLTAPGDGGEPDVANILRPDVAVTREVGGSGELGPCPEGAAGVQ